MANYATLHLNKALVYILARLQLTEKILKTDSNDFVILISTKTKNILKGSRIEKLHFSLSPINCFSANLLLIFLLFFSFSDTGHTLLNSRLICSISVTYLNVNCFCNGGYIVTPQTMTQG
jgi:hypothetical protein